MTEPEVGDPTYRQFALDVIANFEFLNGQIGGGSDDSIPNGSFEIDTNEDGTPDNWTIVSYAGGGNFGRSVAVHAHGGHSFYFTSPGGAAGGGDATTTGFQPTQGERPFYLRWAMASSVATLSNKVIVHWFDKDYAPVAGTPTSEVYANNATNDSRLMYYSRLVAPPSTARYFKVQFIGIEVGTGAGTVWFDHVSFRFLETGNAQLLVAAPDSPLSMRARADMLCWTNDDAADDNYSPVINEALALAAAAGGGRVYLAEGTYYVGKTGGGARITLQAGVELVGFGDRTVIKPHAGTENLLGEALVYANAADRCGLRSVFVNGDEPDGGEFAPGRYGVHLIDCDEATLMGVRLAGMNGSAFLPGSLMKLEACTRATVQACVFDGGRYDGLWVTGGERNAVLGCRFEGNEHRGVFVDDSDHTAVERCEFYGNGGGGEADRHAAHFAGGGVGNLFRGNRVRATAAAANPPGYGVYVAGNAVQVSIEGNYFHGNPHPAVYLAAGSDSCSILGNTFVSNGTFGGSQVVISSSSNAVQGNAFHGGGEVQYPVSVTVGAANHVDRSANAFFGHTGKNGPNLSAYGTLAKVLPTAWRGNNAGTFSRNNVTSPGEYLDRIVFTPTLTGAGLYVAVVSVEHYGDAQTEGYVAIVGDNQVGSTVYDRIQPGARQMTAVLLFDQAPGSIRIKLRQVSGPASTSNVYCRNARAFVLKVENPDSTGWF